MAIRHTFQSLAGQLLVAMPNMPDQRFRRAVILMCAHSPTNAMGLVVNKAFDEVDFAALVSQLDLPAPQPGGVHAVHMGGPVEQGRGFVLHSTDLMRDESLTVTEGIALTGSVDMLRAIVAGQGPRRVLFALGYAGWGPGQLDAEIQANGWLHVPADPQIVFDTRLEHKWDSALARLGIDAYSLSSEAGRA